MEKYRTEPIKKTIEVYWGYRPLQLSTDEICIVMNALHAYYYEMREEEARWKCYEDGVNPAGQESNAVWSLIQEIQSQATAWEEEIR